MRIVDAELNDLECLPETAIAVLILIGFAIYLSQILRFLLIFNPIAFRIFEVHVYFTVHVLLIMYVNSDCEF